MTRDGENAGSRATERDDGLNEGWGEDGESAGRRATERKDGLDEIAAERRREVQGKQAKAVRIEDRSENEPGENERTDDSL